MSKSILVIDTPETCENCECKYPSYKDDSLYDCAITGRTVPIAGMVYGKKPNWCPLRDLPEKKPKVKYQGNGCFGINEATKNSFNMGFNSCIDEISKGENGNEQRTSL